MKHIGLLLIILATLFVQPAAAQNLPDYYEPYAAYREGVTLYDLGRYSAAMDYFERFIAAENSFAQAPEGKLALADAEFYRALCSYNLLRQNAPLLLEQFARKYPNHAKTAVARYYIGKLLFIKKKYEEAPEQMEGVTPEMLSEADYIESQFMLGYSYYMTKRKEQAAKTFAPICDKLGEYHDKANYYYGVTQYERQQFSDGLKAFTNIEKSEEYREKVPVYIVGCLIGMNDREGLEAYGKQLQASEDQFDQKREIFRQIGASLYQLALYDKAIPFYESYIKDNAAADRGSIYSLGYSCYAMKDYTPAMGYFKRLMTGTDTVAQLSAYYLGFAYRNAEKHKDAAAAFLRAKTLKLVPNLANDALYHYAKSAFDAKDLKVALDALNEYAEANPDGERASEINALIGEVLLADGKFKQAIDYFEKSGLKDERGQEAFQKAAYYYAVEQYGKKNFGEADKYFEKVHQAQNDPALSNEALFWRGEIAFYQNKTDLAKQRYEHFLTGKGASKSAQFLPAKLGLGWCALKTGDYAAAADKFQDLLDSPSAKKRPDLYAEAAIRAGDCRFIGKRYDEAAELYGQAIGGGKGSVDYAYYQRGLCNARLNQKQAAVKDFNTVLSNYKKSEYADNALFELADANLKWFADYSKTKVYAERLINEFPESEMAAMANNLLAYAALNSDDPEGAANYFKQTLFTYGRSEGVQIAADELAMLIEPVKFAEIVKQFKAKFPDAAIKVDNLACNLGRDLLLVEQNYAEAIVQLTECLASAPDKETFNESTLYRAEAYAKTNQVEKALADYERIYSASSNATVKAYAGAADLYFTQKKYDKALELLQSASALADNNVDQLTVQFGLSKVFLVKKDFAQAKSVLHSVLENPKTTNFSRFKIMVQMGQVYYGEGKLDSAKTIFESVESDSKTAFGAESQYMLCKIYFAKKDYDECKKAALYLTEEYNGFNDWKARAFIVLAENYFEQGEKEQALETLKSIIEKTPDAAIKKEAEAVKAKLEKRKPVKRKETTTEGEPDTETSMKE